MNKYIVILIVIAMVVSLYFGHMHWKSKTVAAGIEGAKTSEKYLEKKNKEKTILINRLKPEKNKKQSLADFLRYRALTEDKISIAVLGSNVTVGREASDYSLAWPQLIKGKLQSDFEELNSLKVLNYGFEGYSTADLLDGKKVDLLINEEPDLVIFENCMINNFTQSISLQKTIKELKDIMDMLQKQLPNTKIIMISPNPVGNSNEKNSLGLNYLEYVKASGEMSKKEKWSYINNVNEINNKLKDENIMLVDILANDYVHLNNKGHYLLFEVLYERLMKKS